MTIVTIKLGRPRAIEESSCTRSLENCVWEIRPASNAALTIIGPTMGQRSSESSTRTTIVLYYCTRSYEFDAVTPPENLFDASLAQFQIVSSMSTKEVAQGRRRNRCPNAEPRNLSIFAVPVCADFCWFSNMHFCCFDNLNESVKSMKACCTCKLLNVVLIHFRWRRLTRSSKVFLQIDQIWTSILKPWNLNLMLWNFIPSTIDSERGCCLQDPRSIFHALLALADSYFQTLALCVFVLADWDYIWFLNSITFFLGLVHSCMAWASRVNMHWYILWRVSRVVNSNQGWHGWHFCVVVAFLNKTHDSHDHIVRIIEGTSKVLERAHFEMYGLYGRTFAPLFCCRKWYLDSLRMCMTLHTAYPDSLCFCWGLLRHTTELAA